MTTSIRNIMRNQDKGLLTTTARLLNAGVRKAEVKANLEKRKSMSPDDANRPKFMDRVKNKSTISTIDLLQRKKLGSSEASNKPLFAKRNPHGADVIMPAASMPVMPTLNQLYAQK
jgi:hypothetical protein